MPAGCHVQIVPVWTGPTDVSDGGWHTTAVTPAGGRLPDRTASINPSHVFVMSALTLRTRRHPTQTCRSSLFEAAIRLGNRRDGSGRSIRRSDFGCLSGRFEVGPVRKDPSLAPDTRFPMGEGLVCLTDPCRQVLHVTPFAGLQSPGRVGARRALLAKYLGRSPDTATGAKIPPNT